MVEYKNKRLDALFHALANTTRREILMLLATRPHHLSEFTSTFGISLTAISGHVHVLDQAGLVHRRFVGRKHVCSINMDALDVLALLAWTKHLAAHALTRSPVNGRRMQRDTAARHKCAPVKRIK